MPQRRRVRIKNESSVNINVNWHIFIEEEKNNLKQPISLALDIYNSTTNELPVRITSIEHEGCEEEYLNSPEMKLNIIPNYGREDFKIFQVNIIFLEQK